MLKKVSDSLTIDVDRVEAAFLSRAGTHCGDEIYDLVIQVSDGSIIRVGVDPRQTLAELNKYITEKTTTYG